MPAASRVRVTPGRLALMAGDTARLRAVLSDAGGRVLPGPASWTSSDPIIAGVSVEGVVTAGTAGTVVIVATSGTARGEAQVTVSVRPPAGPAPVASLEVQPGELRLAVGGTASLGAEALDSLGDALAGRAIRWSSSDPKVARVSRSGGVTGVGAGTAVITASSEGVTSEPVRVTVDAATPVRYGVVRMLVNPWAYVVIDGRGRGQRVRGEERLPAGVHRFRFERSGFITVDTTITLQPDEQRLLRIQMRAR
jgi:uncharacterized protein YjdB